MVTKGTKKKASGVGVGLAALAAAAAGAYFLYGKNGAQNRKKVKGWMLKAKGEVLEQMEKMKDVSQDKYNTVVDRVGDKYKNVKNVDPDEVAQMVKELKGHWSSIMSQIQGKPKKATKKKTIK